MIKNYLKVALRNFWKHKMFSIINIVGLSIGICSALAIYVIAHFDLSFDRFHPNADKIYRVVSSRSVQGQVTYSHGVTAALPPAAASALTGVDAASFFLNPGEFSVSVNENRKKPSLFKDQEDIIYCDANYFTIFQYKWLAGSAAVLNNPDQVVLTSLQAKAYYPGLTIDQIIGKTITYNDSVKTVVSGIVESFTENSDLTFHDFISFKTLKPTAEMSDWNTANGESQYYIRLNKSGNANFIEAQLNNLLKSNAHSTGENQNGTRTFHLQPLNDLHFNENYRAYDNPTVNLTTVYELIGIAVFLLLLGCINFINLNTAKGFQRAKEIGIRKTMGGTRGQLILQFLTEAFLLVFLAVAIAVFLVPYILKIFTDFIPEGVAFDLKKQPDVIIFLAVLSFSVTMAAGFYPAMLLSGYKPTTVLKTQVSVNTGTPGKMSLRKFLTVTQFVIAQFFIMSTVMVSKQINYAVNKDLGFRKDGIIYLRPPFNPENNKMQVFINRIQAIPQVEMVSVGSDVPSSNSYSSNDVVYRDGKNEIKTELLIKSADPNYLSVFRIKLLAGRNITFADSLSGMLVNNTYANAIGYKSPQLLLGKIVDFGDKKRQIIGVISDFHQTSLRTEIKPLAIIVGSKNKNKVVSIALKPETGNGEWSAAISKITVAWKDIYADEVLDYHFFDESIAKFYKKEQHTATLLKWATGLSIIISCLGLLGLVMFTSSLRQKEIGVRKVLGASVTQIITLLSSELLWLVVVALIIVVPISFWAMNKWLQGFADKTPVSWWIFAVSGMFMLLLAMITMCVQTIRLATANPVKSIRAD